MYHDWKKKTALNWFSEWLRGVKNCRDTTDFPSMVLKHNLKIHPYPQHFLIKENISISDRAINHTRTSSRLWFLGEGGLQRMVEVGRCFWRLSCPIPLLKQSHLKQVVQGHVQWMIPTSITMWIPTVEINAGVRVYILFLTWPLWSICVQTLASCSRSAEGMRMTRRVNEVLGHERKDK